MTGAVLAMYRLVSFIFLYLAALVAQADTVLQLALNKQQSLCSFVLNRLERCIADNRGGRYEPIAMCSPRKLVGDWKREEGSYHWVSPTMNQKVPAQFARYDIDNDGEDEIILFGSFSIRSSYNEALFIFKRGSIDFTLNPQLTLSDLNKQPRIASDTAWPYSDHGLLSLVTAPLVHQGTHYVVLMDELFARRAHPDRRFVVAKYTGVEVHGTDKLDILCSIQPYQEANNVRRPKRKPTPN
jgi:hypothetical protein